MSACHPFPRVPYLRSIFVFLVLCFFDQVPARAEMENAGYHGLAAQFGDYRMGAFRTRTTSTGRVTGTMRLIGQTLIIRGAFSKAGEFSQTFPPSGKFAGGTLELSMFGTSYQSGTFYSDDGRTYEVSGTRAKSGSQLAPVAEKGYYTAYTSGATYTVGAANFSLMVHASGAVRILGRVPGNAAVATGSQLTQETDVPTFIRLRRNQGFIAGAPWIVASEEPVVSGALRWVTEMDDILYPMVDEAQLTGRHYVPPTRGQRILDDFDRGDGSARFSNLMGDPLPFTWRANNTALLPVRNALGLRLTLQSRTGFFGGSIKNSEGKATRFYGICVQHSQDGDDVATGYYDDSYGFTMPVDIYRTSIAVHRGAQCGSRCSINLQRRRYDTAREHGGPNGADAFKKQTGRRSIARTTA